MITSLIKVHLSNIFKVHDRIRCTSYLRELLIIE